MKTTDVMIARIYISESSKLLKQILHYLKNEAKIRGISVFRAVSGFGTEGEREAFLLDLSLDLPLVLEFFDDATKIALALEHLSQVLKPEHMVVWEAKANI